MIIDLQTDRDIKSQAIAAGFPTVEEYLLSLLARDAERVAILEGIDAMNSGEMQLWDAVDAEIRQEFRFAPNA